MPRTVAKLPKHKEVDAWTEEQVARFLSASADHRWAVAFRLGVLYGLRRSEALALKWNDLDTKKGTLRIDEGLIAVSTGAVWSEGKNARSRRVIPLDDLIVATHAGRPVMPRSLDRALGPSSRTRDSPASPRTAFATPRRLTWCEGPVTSASSEQSLMCSATPPTCS
jgi:integrase